VSVIKPLLQARNAGPRADDRTVLYFLAAGDRVALATSRRAKTAHGCAKGLHLAHVTVFSSRPTSVPVWAAWRTGSCDDEPRSAVPNFPGGVFLVDRSKRIARAHERLASGEPTSEKLLAPGGTGGLRPSREGRATRPKPRQVADN
jgi:hypothetical protein